MGRDGNPRDEEAPPTEVSPLLPTSEVLSPAGSESSEGTQRLWEEVSQPWPATYERSIALLASPIISPKQVELFTQSPKPGASPMALAQLRRVSFKFVLFLHATIKSLTCFLVIENE